MEDYNTSVVLPYVAPEEDEMTEMSAPEEASHAKTDVVTDAEASTDTSTDTSTEANAETVAETVAEANAVTNANSDANSTDAVTETVTENETETETDNGAESDTDADAEAEAEDDGAFPTADEIRKVIYDVVDPEINISIIDLGLVYEILPNPEDKTVTIKMTLTSPGCPLGPEITSAVYLKVTRMPGVKDCCVDLVWSPMWDPEVNPTEETRIALGMW